MKQYKVAIARFPANGWECTQCVEWLIKTVVEMKKDDRISEVISVKPGGATPITMLRNKAVVDAKKEGADFLLMIDSDMSPDLAYPGAKPFWATAWEFMLKRRWSEDLAEEANSLAPATIAAPYCGPPPDEVCYFFRFTNRETDSPNPNFRLEMIPREMAAIMSGIQQMDALPTGLILYDMRVFDVLPPPWYQYEYSDKTESEKATTEDVFQTRNASLLGLPQYIALDCWAGHVKTKVVTKPQIITADRVHSSLVDAVKRGLHSEDRLIMVNGEADADGIPDIDTIEAQENADAQDEAYLARLEADDDQRI